MKKLQTVIPYGYSKSIGSGGKITKKHSEIRDVFFANKSLTIHEIAIATNTSIDTVELALEALKAKEQDVNGIGPGDSRKTPVVAKETASGEACIYFESGASASRYLKGKSFFCHGILNAARKGNGYSAGYYWRFATEDEKSKYGFCKYKILT